jgi:hypothetical protein
MKCKKCDRNIADPVSNYCGACIHNAFAELEAKLERAAGDVKWSTEQYADCADELKKARAKNAKLLEAIRHHKREIEEKMAFSIKEHCMEDRELWTALDSDKQTRTQIPEGVTTVRNAVTGESKTITGKLHR